MREITLSGDIWRREAGSGSGGVSQSQGPGSGAEGGGALDIGSKESLILAQDERWRRA